LILVGGRAQPANLLGGLEQGVGNLAGDHVDFVVLGNGNHHLGILRSCAQQHIRVGGPSGGGANVHMILEFTQQLGIGIDHGDVICLAREDLRQGSAHFVGAKNDYFHCCQTFSRVCSRVCERNSAASLAQSGVKKPVG